VFELGITRLVSDGLGDDLDPQYAPTGSSILFRSFRAPTEDTGVLYLADRNGSNLQPISDSAGTASNAAWSPTDDLIVYQSDINGDLDLFVCDISSRQTRQLTDNDVDDYAPTWLCGTSEVIFTTEIDGNPNIYQVAARPMDAPPVDLTDETEATQLTDHELADVYPTDSPTEDDASREGLFPRTRRFTLGQTRFLPIETDNTVIDDTLLEGGFDPLTVCTEPDTEIWLTILENRADDDQTSVAPDGNLPSIENEDQGD
jgi:dipeptidyl aminopeptidase/acylaminoacyl peptidase